MEKDKLKTQMKKGILELCVFSVLMKGEAYPNDIISYFSANNFDIPEGTLYPILTRFKNAAFVEYRWVESTEGPPRKYFKITTKGEKHFELLLEAWTDIQNSVKNMIKSRK